VAAAGGDVATARGALAALGADATRSPSLRRRLAALAAHGELAAAEGRTGEMRLDLAAAIAVAQRLESKVDEVQLRQELARIAANRAAT